MSTTKLPTQPKHFWGQPQNCLSNYQKRQFNVNHTNFCQTTIFGGNPPKSEVLPIKFTVQPQHFWAQQENFLGNHQNLRVNHDILRTSKCSIIPQKSEVPTTKFPAHQNHLKFNNKVSFPTTTLLRGSTEYPHKSEVSRPSSEFYIIPKLSEGQLDLLSHDIFEFNHQNF